MEDKILFLKSPCKAKSYGGNWIYEKFHIGDDSLAKIGEFWAISAHENGLSVIENGTFKGKTLKNVYEKHRDLFNHDENEKFPILVKINELNGCASVQVHPDNEYCKQHYQDLGKAEFNLYLEAEKGSKLVRGHTAKTKEEFLKRAKNAEWDSLICRMPLHKGDYVFTPPGIVHGGEGYILMVEVQQSSDVTLRIYDYDNKDEFGNPRETHLDEAVNVMSFPHEEVSLKVRNENKNGNEIIHYIDNQYFIVTDYIVHNVIDITNHSYSLCLALSGNGSITLDGEQYPLEMGKAFIITSKCKRFTLNGDIEVLITEPPR